METSGAALDGPRDHLVGSGRHSPRTQDAFAAPRELPRDPLAGPPPEGGRNGAWDSGRDSLGVPERSLGVPRDARDAMGQPPSATWSSRDAMGQLGVLRSSAEAGVHAQARDGGDDRGDRNVVAVVMSTADLAVALDEEERELWRQLRRKSEFELRVAEKRAQLAELRDRRRGVSSACADATASIDNLTGQVDFIRMHEREIEHDVAVLQESNRIMQSAFQAKKLKQKEAGEEVRMGHLPPHLTESERLAIRQQAREKANSIELKREQEAVLEYEQITHLRAHLERLVAEKSNLQQRQQALLEKQHASEQDRNLLLSSLQEERKGINDLRHDRLRLWEERHNMEREMTQIVQEAHFRVLRERAPQRYRGGVDPNVIAAEENGHILDPFAQDLVAGKSVLVGGVRVQPTLDTPAAFKASGEQLWSSGFGERKENVHSHALPNEHRKEWTRFAGDAVQRGGSGVVDSGGAGFGLSAFGTAPAASGAVTEWSGRLQEFRSSGSAF